MRCQYHLVDEYSGVGVLDKAVAILSCLHEQPMRLNELVEATGYSRPTVHRLALALEHHHLVARDGQGRFELGPRMALWGSGLDPLRGPAERAVIELRDRTGLSAQVYRRVGNRRLCIAAAEPASGLRDTVPTGAMLTMKAGSAAQVLAAWAVDRAALCRGAAFTGADLDRVRKAGWAHSLGQREPGVGSLAAPIRDQAGEVCGAVSISGPIERLARPSASQRAALLDTAADLSQDAGK
jgi:DNA-binding IclR family transcriptional regulator